MLRQDAEPLAGNGVLVLETGNTDIVVRDALFPQCRHQVVGVETALFDVGVSEFSGPTGRKPGNLGDCEILQANAGPAAGTGNV